MVHGLDFKPAGQGQFLQLGGDGLRPQRIHVPGHYQIHIRPFRVGALGPGAEQDRGSDLRMAAENAPHQFQFTSREGRRRVHFRLSAWRNSWTASKPAR